MKYMMIMRPSLESVAQTPSDPEGLAEMIKTMGDYNESLVKAGVFLSAEGLAPVEEGVVLDFDQRPPLVSDGPFAEAKEVFAGFWILQVATKEEAVEWATRCPLGPGVRLEVRRIQDISELGIDNEDVRRERARGSAADSGTPA